MKLDCVGVGFYCEDFLLRISNMPSFKGPRGARILSFSRQGGGLISTGLVTMSKLGAKVGYMGKVGDDDHGLFLIDEYSKYDIHNCRVELCCGISNHVSSPIPVFWFLRFSQQPRSGSSGLISSLIAAIFLVTIESIHPLQEQA